MTVTSMRTEYLIDNTIKNIGGNYIFIELHRRRKLTELISSDQLLIN